ncbi:hypothetical protein XarzCFBP7410_00810 [Xanthomonas arboricola pv. zantedeschiae]|nr:hypothetical protein XarzCFBP7410_00810 [Xanthomonas arboricola pv. zantedeschiae]
MDVMAWCLDSGFGIRDSGFGDRGSGIGDRESGIGNRKSRPCARSDGKGFASVCAKTLGRRRPRPQCGCAVASPGSLNPAGFPVRPCAPPRRWRPGAARTIARRRRLRR